jgi:hypothetical protein
MEKDKHPSGNELIDEALQAELTCGETVFLGVIAATWALIVIGIFRLIF